MRSQLGLLGEVEFNDSDGALAPLVRANQRRMVAVIGTYYREPVSSEWLAELLGLTPGGLRTRIRRMRQIIGDDSIITQASGYRLGAVRIDVEEFEERRLAAYDDPDTETRLAALRAALAVWRGDALNEFAHEPWAAGEAARLNELRSTVEDDVAKALIAVGRQAEAIADLESQLSRNPFRDSTRRLVMLALAHDGRHAEALRAFQEYREFLIDETGTEPPEETKRLEQLILTGDLGLVPSPVQVQKQLADVKPAVLTLVCIEVAMPQSSPELIASLKGQHELPPNTSAVPVASHDTGYTVAFEDPVAAADWSKTLQRQRSSSFHEAPGISGLAIGVHSGLGYHDASGHTGATLDRARDIAQAANPGQVLLSSAAAELVAQHHDFHLMPRGNHRLHAGAQVELIELLWSETPSAGMPLRTVTDVPTNVPAVRPTLLGRDAELAALDALLDRHRLITVIGPGGAGKSALAIESAARLPHRFPDGVFVVEFAAVADPVLVENTIAMAIGLRSEPSGHTADSLAIALRNKRQLIVIDNAELLLDPVAEVAQALLTIHGPTLIVTSREWLDVPGEQTYHLPTLGGLAPSGRTHGAELFLANAAAAGVGVHQFDDETVEELCQRLDHLPLALELAAGSAMHLTPTQILGSLERGERLRSTRRRNRVRRFTSVDEMLEGSFELLDASERSMLIALSVFRGPSELAAIEAVWNGAGTAAAAEMLGSLVLRSLVVATASTDGFQYRLLETVRDFARDQAMVSGTFRSLQRAHRDWFLQASEPSSLLEQFGSTRRARAFEQQLANFREAMAHSEAEGELHLVHRQAVQLTSLWFTFMHGDEGLRWFQVGADGVTKPAERLLHLMGTLTTSFASEQWDDALEATVELGELCQHSELPETVLGWSLFGITHVINLDVGLEALDVARRREAILQTGLGPVVDYLSADLLTYSGRYKQAFDNYQATIDALDADEFAWFVASALVGSGLCLHVRGHHERGLEQIGRSLEISRSMPDSLGGVTRGVAAQAVIMSSLGNCDEARVLLSAEIERNERRTSLATVRAEPLVAVVHLALDTGDTTLAHSVQSLLVELGMYYRSPWQHLLGQLATERLHEMSAPDMTSIITIDDAIQRSQQFLRAPVIDLRATDSSNVV